MSVYTVHAPPSVSAAGPDPERFVFVRDGFHFWAFVFGPVWLLFRRLWLAFVIYIVVVGVLQAAMWLIAVPLSAHSALTVLAHLLLGLEAATAQRWTLKRSQWAPLGVVTGESRDAAEQRFFDRWVARARTAATPQMPPPPPPRPAPPPMRPPEPPTDIIGLFPEPQPRP
jgi:Protein of unknown function (DUF2628)